MQWEGCPAKEGKVPEFVMVAQKGELLCCCISVVHGLPKSSCVFRVAHSGVGGS